jgi:ketosteroid isomerase-like protein
MRVGGCRPWPALAPGTYGVRVSEIEGASDASIVVRFNDRINARDIDGLAGLMSDDHAFIDSAEGRVVGKPDCVAAWRGFFAAYPDYRNIFDAIDARPDLVVVTGRSVCADARLAGPAIWAAKVRGGRVTEWRVYEDTPDTRALLAVA